jgi:RNA polymerase sigma-70 factor, ECF subfamily
MTLIYGQLNWDRGRAFAASAKPQSPEQSPARATIARLRAFSLLLCMDTKIANELVEITLVRASVSTDLSHLNPSHLAWLISRLRSYFYAKYAHRQVPVGPRPPLFAVTWQRHGDLLAALSGLTVEQREALILIEAAGLSYKEGARICHRPFLTFKKFVEQARVDLALGLSGNAAETYVEEVLLKAFRGFVLET